MQFGSRAVQDRSAGKFWRKVNERYEASDYRAGDYYLSAESVCRAGWAGPRLFRRNAGNLWARQRGGHRPSVAADWISGYHMEYGYSCIGYEIPGAMGAKMADPSREVFVFVGDGTYQMMPTEIATAVQEGVKLIIVLVDNHGYASIGGLSESIGSAGFGTRYRERSKASGELDGKVLTVDYVANARSLGAIATKASTIAELKEALARAKSSDHTNVIVVETEREVRVPSYDSWWDVAVAEVSEDKKVQAARSRYEEARRKERYYL